MTKFLMGLVLFAGSTLCQGEVLRYSLENIDRVKEEGGMIYLEGGQQIPVTLRAEGMMHLSDQKICNITLDENVFIKIDENEELLFSPDMKEWRPFAEMFTGTMSAETKSIDGKAGFGLSLDLRFRE